VGELSGHVGGVAAVAAAEHSHQAFTLAGDGALAAWDLRTLRQLQRITKTDWSDAEDSSPGVMVYDPAARRLLTATRRPAAWRHGGAASQLGGSCGAEAAVLPGGGCRASEAELASGGASCGAVAAEATEAGGLPWTEPPLWLRPHRHLHLGAIPPGPSP
jgi:hypothetical protein